MDVKLLLRAMWDRILGWLLIGAGALALLLGWIGTSGTPFVYKQLPYLASGGLVGISMIGVGATLLLAAELRDEWRKLDELQEGLAVMVGERAGRSGHVETDDDDRPEQPSAGHRRRP